MSKAKQLKKNPNSPKHPSTLKKGNKRRVGGKKDVNQALIENLEQRLEQFHAIMIHKRIELNPVRDKVYPVELNQIFHKESEITAEKQKTTDGLEPRSFSYSIIVPEFLIKNKPWLSKQVDLGSRIIKFIKSQDPNLAARTIRDYPETVFYDDADICLCLFLTFNPEEINNLLVESTNDPVRSRAVFPGNPFRKQILRWEFLSRWGNRQEQIESKKFLMEAKAEALTPYLRRGSLPGSRVSKKEVVTTYKRILRDIQSFFKKGKLKYTMEQSRTMLRDYIMPLTHLESFPPITGAYDDLDEKFKTGVIIDRLLGEDTSEMRYVNRFGRAYKKNKERRITNIHPFNPFNIALHLTGYLYNISPDTVRSHLYR